MGLISVPFAPASYKIVAGIPLLIFSALAFYWGAKNLRLCIGMLQGKVPLPPRSSPAFVVVGMVLSLVALAVGAGAALFFVALETTQPTIISQDGILVGAGPPHYRQIHSLGRDHQGHVLPSTEKQPDSKPGVVLARFRSGARECWSILGKRSRNREDQSPSRRNSAVRTPRLRLFMVLLVARRTGVCRRIFLCAVFSVG
jgi:hypothetical protein